MSRLINFFDGVTSGTTPTIGNLVASALVKYADDATYEASETGSPVTGNIYYNTTTDRIRYYDGTSWINVVSEATVDTLTNKTIDADSNTISNIDNDEIKAGAAIDASKLADGSVSNTELQHINSVTSNVQDQLDSNNSDISDIRTTIGTADGDTHMGTYPGGLLTDNQPTKQNITELETQVETNTSDIATLTSNPAFVFQGSYDVLTNIPALIDGTGTVGHSYKLTTAGSRDFGAGSISFIVGDLIFYDGSVWDKDKEQVASVAGKQGVVTLDTDDVSEAANLYYTETRVTNNVSVSANTSKVSFPEAPNDANQYAREALGWTVITPASTAGGLKNLVSADDSNFENGVGNWVTFDDGAVSTPIDGTGGSPTQMTRAVTTVLGEVLEGSQSLKISKLAADGQGEGVSVNLEDIELSFQDGIIYGSFFYDFTDVNYTGTVGVWIYDIDGSAIINIKEFSNLVTQTKGRFKFTFSAPDNSPNVSDLRLILMETSTNANSYDLIIDSVKATPNISLTGNLLDVDITLHTSPGYGSSATRILRFSNTFRDTANGVISFTSDSTNGASFTILQEGTFEVYLQFQSSDSSREYGITLNQTTLTTNITGNPTNEIIASDCNIASRRTAVSVNRHFIVGDVIRANTDGGTVSTLTDDCRFGIRRVVRE